MINRWLIGYCLFVQYKSLSAIWLFHLLPPTAKRQSRDTAEKIQSKATWMHSPSSVGIFICRFRFCAYNSVKRNQIKNYVVEYLSQFRVGLFRGLGERDRKLLCAADCPSKCINLHKIDCILSFHLQRRTGNSIVFTSGPNEKKISKEKNEPKINRHGFARA